MIKITGLEKKLSDDFTLKIDELIIERGDRVALIGLNGSGKSTLLRLIAGVLKPDKGVIECNARTAKTGYQPQSPYAFRGSAEYNIGVAPNAPKELSGVLKLCELETLADKKMSSLSGGEKQRVFLARMLAGDYELLLLDEPLSAADLQTGARLASALKTECISKNKTLLFSTHLPKHAFETANKYLLMNGGRIAESGSIEQMKDPVTDFGKAFFSLWNV